MKKVLALGLTFVVAGPQVQVYALDSYTNKHDKSNYTVLLHEIEKSAHPGRVKKLLTRHPLTDTQLDTALTRAHAVTVHRQNRLEELERDYHFQKAVYVSAHKKPSLLRSCVEVGAGVGMVVASGLYFIPGAILLGCGIKNFAARHKHSFHKRYYPVPARLDQAYTKYLNACNIEAALEQVAL